jgi:hypothetical protein
MHCRYLALLWGATLSEAAAAKSSDPEAGVNPAGLRVQKHYDTFSWHVSKVAKVIIPIARPPSTMKAAAAAATNNQEPRRRWWGGRGHKRNATKATSAPTFAASMSSDVVSHWDNQWGGGGSASQRDDQRGAKGKGKSSKQLGTDGKGRSRSAQDLVAPLYASPPMSPLGSAGVCLPIRMSASFALLPWHKSEWSPRHIHEQFYFISLIRACDHHASMARRQP